MLNVTIQNDGRIKIQSECSSTKEMRSNVNLLLALVSSMEMEEKVNKNGSNTSNSPSYYLYLNKVDYNNKLKIVKAIRDTITKDTKEAKDIVEAVANGEKMMIMQSFHHSVIESARESLEEIGCTCEITSN